MIELRTRVLLAAMVGCAVSGGAIAQTTPATAPTTAPAPAPSATTTATPAATPNGAAAPAGTAPAVSGTAPSDPGVEKHLAGLHKLLGITPAEEPQWNEFAAVARTSGQDRDAAIQSNRDAIAGQTAPEIMRSYSELMLKQGQDLQMVSTAFDKLYGSLPADQQKAADTAFRKNGERRASREVAARSR